MRAINKLAQQSRLALYQLKKDYGASILIYKLLTTDTSVTTGQKNITVSMTPVRRAIIMPKIVNRTSVQSISLISSNKEFVSGGTYDQGTRDFIVDRRDVRYLPSLTADDWIIYNRKKYQIKTVEHFEVDAGWIITAKELVGEVPELLFPASSALTLGQSVAGVIGPDRRRSLTDSLSVEDSASGAIGPDRYRFLSDPLDLEDSATGEVPS